MEIVGILLIVVLVIIVIAGMWKMFEKAGQPGWACIVPIYNSVILLKIACRPIWWILLMLIPFVSIIVVIVVYADIAKNFGKGVGFALGMIFLSPIFIPILGFGSAQYEPVRDPT